jgi:hypothetical protein
MASRSTKHEPAINFTFMLSYPLAYCLYKSRLAVYNGASCDIDNSEVKQYHSPMNDIQELLAELQGKGWTIAAIADELDVHRETVSRWRSGHSYPDLAAPVKVTLRRLLQRRRIPKRKRYNKTHPLQRGRG